MIKPTTPSTARAARVINQRNPVSGLSTDRYHAGGLLVALLTSEMFGDSDVPMGCLASDEEVSSLACEAETETLLSGTAPIRSLLLLTWLKWERHPYPLPPNLAMRLLKDNETGVASPSTPQAP